MNVESSPETVAGTDRSNAEEFLELPRKQFLLTLTGVMLALFINALSQMIFVTALPRIMAELGEFDHYTWPATVFMISFTVTVPIAGRFIDIYGRKIFLILGIAVFIIGSTSAGISQSMTQLIASLSVQGIGCGFTTISCYVAIADLFPPEKRGKSQGLASAVFGIATVTGPILGGFIADNFSWNWLFLLNVPIGIPVLLLVAWTFPGIRPEVEIREPDYPGIITLVLAVTLILLALSWGGVRYDWSSLQVMGLLLSGLTIAIAFVVIESRSVAPIMPLDIYRNRVMAVSVIVTLLTGVALYVCIIFIPLFLQGVLGVSATRSGSYLVPLLLGLILGGILSGQLLAGRVGHYRTQAVLCAAVMVAAMYLISTINETTAPARIVAYLAVMGVGLSGALVVFIVAVQNSVPFSMRGTATSALQFFRQIGGALGLAVLGAVMTAGFTSRLEQALPQHLQSLAPAGWLDTIKDNPRALADPHASDELRAGFAQSDPDGIQGADLLLDSVNPALAEAVRDVFRTTLWITALALFISLFLNMPSGVARTQQGGEIP